MRSDDVVIGFVFAFLLFALCALFLIGGIAIAKDGVKNSCDHFGKYEVTSGVFIKCEVLK